MTDLDPPPVHVPGGLWKTLRISEAPYQDACLHKLVSEASHGVHHGRLKLYFPLFRPSGSRISPTRDPPRSLRNPNRIYPYNKTTYFAKPPVRKWTLRNLITDLTHLDLLMVAPGSPGSQLGPTGSPPGSHPGVHNGQPLGDTPSPVWEPVLGTILRVI